MRYTLNEIKIELTEVNYGVLLTANVHIDQIKSIFQNLKSLQEARL